LRLAGRCLCPWGSAAHGRSPAFKAKVAPVRLRQQESVAEIARLHENHANIVYKWKRQLLANVVEPEGGLDSVRSITAAKLAD
jgi:transposase-like protein